MIKIVKNLLINFQSTKNATKIQHWTSSLQHFLAHLKKNPQIFNKYSTNPTNFINPLPKMLTLNLILSISLLATPSLANFIFNSFNNDTNDNCIYLNRHRVEFSNCCKYPQVHFKKLYSDDCTDECVGSRDICCSFGCIYRSTDIIDDNNEISVEGLKETLKKSVFHSEEWLEPIDMVVDECVEEAKASESSTAFCKFPWHLMKAVGCSTRKLFLQCPKMKNGAECKMTKQYAEECM